MSTETVLLRLIGPMQSWSMTARGDGDAHRGTGLRPTKSAIIGMIANALGRDFTDSIDDLATLRFGVRVDSPGRVETDHHSAGGGTYQALPLEVATAPKWLGDSRGEPVLDAHGNQVTEKVGRSAKDRPVFGAPGPRWMNYWPAKAITPGKHGGITSSRANGNMTTDHYLADAAFYAAVSGDDPTLMTAIAAALRSPARSLFLGRKAYGPSFPIAVGDPVPGGLVDALAAAEPLLGARGALELFYEPEPGTPGVSSTSIVRDQPVTFSGPVRRSGRIELRTTCTVEPTSVEPRDEDAAADPTTDERDFIDDLFADAV